MGWIESFTAKALEGDHCYTRQVVLESLKTQELKAPHPVSGQTSSATAFKDLNSYNKMVLMFSERKERWWFLHSEKCFFSGFMTEEGQSFFEPRLSNLSNKQFEELSDEVDWAEVGEVAKKWTLDMRHPSPKHFIYDFLWGAKILASQSSTPVTRLERTNSWIDLRMIGIDVATTMSTVPVFPVLDPHIFTMYRRHPELARERINSIESTVKTALRNQSQKTQSPSADSFILIIHLNFEKRRIENLGECLRPSLELLSDIYSLSILIEGPTVGKDEEAVFVPDRMKELRDLVFELESLGIPYQKTAGMSIREKLPILEQASFAILPSGTGAILTNRILEIPSLLHRSKEFTSPSDLEEDSYSRLLTGVSTQPHAAAHVKSYRLEPYEMLSAIREFLAI